MYRPVPRASAGRGFFVPSLEGWIRNSTSRPPRLDAAAVPVTCRSQGIVSPLLVICKICSQSRAKKLATSGQSGTGTHNKEPHSRIYER